MDKIGRIKKKVILISISLSVIAVFSFGIYFLITPNIVVSPPKLVDWAKHKVIVFESDDWGLCSEVPDQKALEKLSNTDFINEFGTYNNGVKASSVWGSSTLESPQDLERLFILLEKYSGADSRQVVFQPNYIMSVPDYQKIAQSGFSVYSDLIIPFVPSSWERGDFIVEAKQGIKKGVWYPEYHGNTHFNKPAWWRLLKNIDKSTLESFKMQSFINGDNEDDYEYQRLSKTQQENTINLGIRRFFEVFGYYPHSSIVPSYTWQTKTEKALSMANVRVIQAKNSQHLKRCFLNKITGKIVNLLGYKLTDKMWQISMGDYNPQLKLYYLNRNVDFEPRGKPDTETDMGAEEAYQKIVEAWEKSEPAIVNTHRVNYVYLKPEFVEENLKQLEWLLNKIQTEHPDVVYLTDWEVAQLYKDGTSILYFGDDIVCRNFTNINQLFKVNITGGKQLNKICMLPENKPLEFTSSKKDIIFTVLAGKTCIVELVNKE